MAGGHSEQLNAVIPCQCPPCPIGKAADEISIGMASSRQRWKFWETLTIMAVKRSCCFFQRVSTTEDYQHTCPFLCESTLLCLPRFFDNKNIPEEILYIKVQLISWKIFKNGKSSKTSQGQPHNQDTLQYLVHVFYVRNYIVLCVYIQIGFYEYIDLHFLFTTQSIMHIVLLDV